MQKIPGHPKNKAQFKRLLQLLTHLMDICEEKEVHPIVYGSLALFVYTKDMKLNVNDIDVLVQEADIPKIMAALEEKGIKYSYDRKWKVMQVRKGDLLIEFDVMERWQKGAILQTEQLKLDGRSVRMLSKKSLEAAYKRAAERSKDNPEGNRKKYEMLASDK